MRALLTGGEGFVGRHLARHLRRGGAEVWATCLGSPPAEDPKTGEGGGAHIWRRADVLDRAAIGRVVDEAAPDRIFHLAGFSSGGEARRRPTAALSVNAGGTLHLLEAARDAGLRGPIVVAGSGDAYGAAGSDPIGEEAPLAPTGVYGCTKAAQEMVARGLGRAWGLDVRIARLFPQIGPGQSDAFVVPSFCRRAERIAREGGGALRVGNLDVVRDFTDVRDGVAGIVAVSGIEAPLEAYNVCSGTGTSIRRILEWVLEAAGVDATVETDPALVRPEEPGVVVGDPARLARATGWRVERDLRYTVRETYRRMVRG